MATQEFRDTVIRIADLAITTDVISDVAFTNCQILGPAILARLDETVIRDCTFDAPSFEAFVWPVDDDREEVVGVIALSRTTFQGCRFQRVGLAVRRGDLETFRHGFTSAS